MQDHLTEEEFSNLMQQRREGKARLHVSRDVARNFFTRVDGRSVKATTGRSIILQKLCVWTGIIASPLVFLFFIGFVFMRFGGAYATLIISFAGICWTVIYGLTSHHGGWLIGTIPFVLSIAFLSSNLSASEPLFLFVLSLWLQRTTYLMSRSWLESIVSGSYEAYEMMVDHVTITPIE